MIVVRDTSSLFYAAEIGCENLFHQLFEELVIPHTVHRELLENKSAGFISRLLSHSWITVQAAEENSLLRDLLVHIDRGESEAIVLALQLNAAYLLIDERRGRSIAKRLQLRTTGLLGFFLLAKEKGAITEVKPWIQKLTAQTNFRYTQSLIETVLTAAGEK